MARTCLFVPMVATALAIMIGVPAEAQPPAVPTPGRGAIIGRVFDATGGDGVAGAVVTLASPGAGRASAAPLPDRIGTDARGYFAFTSLPAGTYSLTVTKLGYVDSGHGVRRPGGPRADIQLAEGERLTDLRIRFWKHGSISGTVLDDGNEPVVGVIVRALRWSIVAGRRRLTSAGQSPTDDRGRYRVASLVPGEYVTVVTSTQSAVPAGIVEAYWRDPTNATLRSAIVSATSVIPQPGSIQSQRVGEMVIVRPGQGVVQPDPAPRGQFLVVPTTFHPSSAASAQAETIVVTSGGQKSADIRLPLVPTVRVTGTLTGPAGPAGLHAIRLIPRSTEDLAFESGFETASTLTDAEGRFTFIGVTPGQYTVRSAQLVRPGPAPPGAAVASGLYASEPVTVGSQDVAIALNLRTGLRVSGRFMFAGTTAQPSDRLRQVPILLESSDGRAITTVLPGPGDPAGTFATYAVPSGRYFVRVGGAPPGWTLKSVVFDGRDVADRPLDLKDADVDGVIVTFTDSPPQLSGAVRTAGGAVDPDASVVVFPVDSESWIDTGTNPRRLRSARVTAAATFVFPSLPAGDYFVAAIPDDDAATWQDPKFLETLSRRAVRVTLTDGDKKVQDLRTVR